MEHTRGRRNSQDDEDPKFSTSRKRLVSFALSHKTELISVLACCALVLLLLLGWLSRANPPTVTSWPVQPPPNIQPPLDPPPDAPPSSPEPHALITTHIPHESATEPPVPVKVQQELKSLRGKLKRAEAENAKLQARLQQPLPPATPSTHAPTSRVTSAPTYTPTVAPTPRPTAAAVPLPPAAPPATIRKAPAADAVAPLHDLADIGIVVMTYNRPDFLRRTLQSLRSRLPATGGVTVYISQDGSDPGVANEAAKHKDFTHMVNPRPASIATPQGGQPVYYYISNHYKFAFTQVFDVHKHKYCIFIEDDMELAVDFFPMFMALFPLMEVDRSIWSVSSWNDNGQSQFVSDPSTIYRSDYFPGLGWGTSNRIWQELKPKWPLGFWDDWLRLPEQRKGRVTLRPEVSRSGNFGSRGASGGEFFAEHIGSIKVNTVPVDFTKQPLFDLLKQTYDAQFVAAVQAASEVSGLAQIRDATGNNVRDFKMVYHQLAEYERFASQNGLMEDSKAGVPRCGYKGVVTIRWKGNRVFFYPANFPRGT